ncbi:MAG TPA: STAS domain-containing protein [Limnobacter sp.]|nr:STAS domain-containing protein [Limnobacter sp.]
MSNDESVMAERVKLSVASLTIADCTALAENIRHALAEGSSVLLDLGDCQEVDTAGLQLLLIIQNDPDVNLRVHWSKPSETVAVKANKLGLMSWINAGFVEN